MQEKGIHLKGRILMHGLTSSDGNENTAGIAQRKATVRSVQQAIAPICQRDYWVLLANAIASPRVAIAVKRACGVAHGSYKSYAY